MVLFVQLTCSSAMAIEDTSVQNSTVELNAQEQTTTASKTKKHWFKKNKVEKNSEPNIEVENITDENTTKLVGKIDFDNIMEKAQEHSYDLQIADFQILIAKQGIKTARADYFPKLNFSAGTEYTKNFRDNRESTVMSIGDAYINPYTRFQSVLGITLTYNIFDFGVRGGSLKVAKEDVKIKELEEQEKYQELNLNVIDTYSKILMIKNQIDINKQILLIEEKNLEYKTRLFNAKELSKNEYNDAIVKVSTIKKRISELSSTLEESLNWLSFYTGEQYDAKNLKVGEIKKSNFDVNEFQDYTKSITWKIHENYIKKKELELYVAKRMNYPKINAYSKYYLYGSDGTSYPDSFGDIKPSNFTVGVSLNTMLFDGMKNRANIGKVKLELQQLHVERDKAMAQFMTRLASMRSNLIYLEEQKDENTKIIKELNEKEKSTKRLVAQRLLTPIEENDVRVQLLEQKIEQDKNSVTTAAIMKGLQILTTEY
ncbi:TolC family protein [bacterium]|nr:TolC family protein [bacterium]